MHELNLKFKTLKNRKIAFTNSNKLVADFFSDIVSRKFNLLLIYLYANYKRQIV